MKLFSGLKAEKNITRLFEERDSQTPGAKKALETLASLGQAAIPIIIEALANADKKQSAALASVLADIINERSFPLFAEGLKHADRRCASGVAWALANSTNYSTDRLLALLGEDDVSMAMMSDILRAQASRLNIRNLVNRAYQLNHQDQIAAFKLVREFVGPELLPELIARIDGGDRQARVQLIQIISKFKKPEVAKVLERLLKDSDRNVRQACVEGLLQFNKIQDIEVVCAMLCDPDFGVQGKAVELLVQLKDPGTIPHLVDALKDESEYTRRSAVEVLNELADADSIKYLLNAIGDKDWWVRSRACDALASIGGPKVTNAALHLIRDKDENIRRSAIEILNQTRDTRAVKHLIAATKDKDWWVRERAADALGDIGSSEAMPALIEMLDGEEKSVPAALRALAKVGDERIVHKVMSLTKNDANEIRIEAIRTLSMVDTEQTASDVKERITAAAKGRDDAVKEVAGEALARLEKRTGSSIIGASTRNQRLTDTGHTMLAEVPTATLQNTPADKRLNIDELEPNDMIEGRYRYIEKVGKGAFGTVLLVEDTVVNEQLILKFLNQAISTDDEMMNRFVHELRFSRKITHNNVIRIYDFLKLAGNYAISMEYFPSHTLGVEIQKQKPMPLRKALNWAKDIATGMAEAHQVGVVHRDLKPANLLINDDGLLKIVDFGVAAAAGQGATDTQLTKTGYVIGSPKYMAPEQILGKKVDHHADIYSVGVIMYEMLTGIPPYSKGDHMAVMYQHVQGNCKPCEEINPNIPANLAAVVRKAMSIEIKDRYDSMGALIGALDELKGS
jgi:eukaryotic-like serine/threonine-protein kinase